MRRLWQGGSFPRAGNGKESVQTSVTLVAAPQHQRSKQSRLAAETWCRLASSSAFWSGFASESHLHLGDERFTCLSLFSPRSVCIIWAPGALSLHSHCSLSGERRCRRKGWLPLLILMPFACCFCGTDTLAVHSVTPPDPWRAPYQQILLPWAILSTALSGSSILNKEINL